MSASSHLLPYALLKMTLLYFSVNYLLGVTGLLASEIKFYQIMFHCIQGLLYVILYLCPKYFGFDGSYVDDTFDKSFD